MKTQTIQRYETNPDTLSKLDVGFVVLYEDHKKVLADANSEAKTRLDSLSSRIESILPMTKEGWQVTLKEDAADGCIYCAATLSEALEDAERAIAYVPA